MVPDPTAVPEAPLEPAGAPHRRRAVVFVAALAVVAVVAAAIGIAGRDGGRSTGPLPRLRLRGAALGGVSGPGARDAVAPEPGLHPFVEYRYVHHGAWPAVPDHATVWRVTAGDLDATAVARLARAFGVDATPAHDATGWTVTDGTNTLRVEITTTSTYVSMYRGGLLPGAAGSTPPAGAGVASGTAKPIAPLTTVPSSTPAITAPAALPSPSEAERIARAVLTRADVLGPTSDWTVTVADSGVVGIATATPCPANADCAPLPQPPTSVVTSRSVTFQRTIDGVAVEGLSWSVEIGDHGAVLGVNGTLGSLDALGSYPLRSVDAAFADVQSAKRGPGIVEPQVSLAPGSSTPAPVTVDVDRVTLTWSVFAGTADGRDGSFVVPMYRFTGHDVGQSRGTGAGDVTIEEAALDGSVVTAPQPPDTVAPTKPAQPAPPPAPPPAPDEPGTPSSAIKANPGGAVVPIVPRPLGTVPTRATTP